MTAEEASGPSNDANPSPIEEQVSPSHSNEKDDVSRGSEDEKSTDAVDTAHNPEEGAIELGGTRAWLVVLGGALSFLNVWGFPISFGVFQAFYTLDYLQGQSETKIAWIGTFSNFLVSMVSVLSGPIYDLGYYRTLVYTGTALNVFGIMMLSLSTQYYQLFLAHTCNGVGSGLLYVPTLALVAQCHGKTRNLAMGIVSCGISLGGILYTIIFLRLQPTIGFAWTIRIMGFIALTCFAIAIPCLTGGRRDIKASGKARALTDLGALRSPKWFVYTFAQFFSFWGYLIPLFYITTYARITIGTTSELSSWLLVVLQATSLFGRLGVAVAAHYFGTLLPLCSFCLIAGILNFTWLVTDTLSSFIAYCVLYGFFSGALIALPPAIFPYICTNPKVQGTWMGMSWAILSMAALTGSPIAGAFVHVDTKTFIGAQLWSGVTFSIGALLFATLWYLLWRQRNKILI